MNETLQDGSTWELENIGNEVSLLRKRGSFADRLEGLG